MFGCKELDTDIKTFKNKADFEVGLVFPSGPDSRIYLLATNDGLLLTGGTSGDVSFVLRF